MLRGIVPAHPTFAHTMVKRFFLPEEMQHPKWRDNVRDTVQPTGLHLSSPSTDWVVKLEFRNDGELTTGSGFFVYIPGASHDVILTAAHNLINAKGNLSTDIVVLLSDSSRVPVNDFRISAAYKVKQTPAADYGAILLPRTSERRGFGFNIKLAFEDYLKGDIHVIGYGSGTPAGQPLESSGQCLRCYEEQLEYRAMTEQGISGSAVWISYQGLKTVVAIHNHRPRRRGGGSRGSRLTPNLLREVFGWVSVGDYDVSLRARDTGPEKTTTLPSLGLYLNFSDDFPFARVRLGSGTKFDVMPAYVTLDKDLYALTVDDKWVTFNTANQEVVLSEWLKDACLFQKRNVKAKKKAMRIVLEAGGKFFQLRLQGTRIRDFDEDAESSEVSMVEYPLEDEEDELFTQFWFVK